MSRAWLVVGLLLGCSQAPRFEPAGPLELLANIDDDDGDHVRDGLDATRNGSADDADFTVVTLRARCRGEVRLSVEPASSVEHLHVFRADALLLDGTKAASLECGTHTLHVEALRPRSGVWNGRATLVATTASGTARLDLRVAPVVFPVVTRPPRRVFAVDVADPKAGANTALLTALRATGVSLTLAPGAEHFFERWMQDAVSAGTMRTDGGALDVLLQMDRPTGQRGLERFAASQLGRDVGLALPGRDETTALSYGGNVEVIPPHAGAPLGRLVVGGSASRKMGAATASWLAAQEVQGPPLELDTSWLETGHIDEVLAFVPRDGGWQGFVASPRLAFAWLDALADAGSGRELRVREGARSVASVAADDRLRAFNLAVAARLDGLRAAFQRETGRQLVELPQVFEPNDAGLALALHPSVVNFISLGPVVLTASTDVDGGVLEPLVVERLSAEGVRAVFVDASAYHPFGGGLHCGVEVQR